MSAFGGKADIEAKLLTKDEARRIAERNVAEVERAVRSYFNKLDDLEPFAYSEPHGFRADRFRLAKAGADWCRPG
jgi:hypothetical protein